MNYETGTVIGPGIFETMFYYLVEFMVKLRSMAGRDAVWSL
jgi:hypothetical protein